MKQFIINNCNLFFFFFFATLIVQYLIGSISGVPRVLLFFLADQAGLSLSYRFEDRVSYDMTHVSFDLLAHLSL